MRFLQAWSDFPVVVSLGNRVPSWGLSRYGGGLRFVPPDDEGYAVRGNSRRLLYMGRGCSHRFTILGDTAFEYDCILNREPDSNVVTLKMEGAGGYDFYRQPDFVADPFLRGSYAVYKKDTLIGEGTGKLCHIQRPLIIDAGGRKVFGDIDVCGDELRITIPEKWLGTAKYPVVVDPAVGTSSVGSQTQWDPYGEDEIRDFYLNDEIGVNRFLLPETFEGAITAFVYAYDSEYVGKCVPVLYSDNSNAPQTKKSKSETPFNIAVSSGSPAGWRSAGLATNSKLTAGSYIWFGLSCNFFYPRFDYGSKYYSNFLDNVSNLTPDTYPLFDRNDYFDAKVSMYFTYSTAQNYQRTLAQGLTVRDNKITNQKFQRTAAQGIPVKDNRIMKADYSRETAQGVQDSQSVNIAGNYLRSLMVKAGNTALFTFPVTVTRILSGMVSLGFDSFVKNSYLRTNNESVGLKSNSTWLRHLCRNISSIFKTDDTLSSNSFFIRASRDNADTRDLNNYWWVLYRAIIEAAGSYSGPYHATGYNRATADTAYPSGTVYRKVFIVIKIAASVLFREVIVKRFLQSTSELKLKSAVCREIRLDSRV